MEALRVRAGGARDVLKRLAASRLCLQRVGSTGRQERTGPLVYRLQWSCLAMSEPPLSRTGEIMRGLAFGAMGLLMLAVVGLEVNHRLAFLRVAQIADGHVESLNAGGSHPQVAFTTAAGERVSYAQGGMIFGYEPGQAVRVLYQPARPARQPSLDSFGALWGMTLMVALIGLTFVGIALRAVIRRSDHRQGS
ncbi:MAG: DUF3592 domain-containing protein [Stenotrophomonas sp.]